MPKRGCTEVPTSLPRRRRADALGPSPSSVRGASALPTAVPRQAPGVAEGARDRERPDRGGSQQVRLTTVHRTGRAAGGATFSPDGRRIVYRFANLDTGRSWLSVMRLDG